MLKFQKTLSFCALLLSLMLAKSVQAEVLTIPGSGSPEFALRALAEAFNQHQTSHQVIVPSSTGTAGALIDVGAGTAVMGRVGRPLKPEEAARGLAYIPFGRDAVTFAAGAGVSLKGLTSEQVLSIYEGRMTNWKELGANPGPIRALGRESTDTSRQSIERYIKAFKGIEFSSQVKVAHLDPQMIELLDRFPTSLGFLSTSALKACKTKISYLSLDGIEPTAENVASGHYPIWAEFGLIHKAGTLSPAAKAFVEYIQSPAGARILQGLGLVPTAAER